MLANELIAKC